MTPEYGEAYLFELNPLIIDEIRDDINLCFEGWKKVISKQIDKSKTILVPRV
jgi:hypothetical protein